MEMIREQRRVFQDAFRTEAKGLVERTTGSESTRFGALAMALWSDLVAHEEVG